MIEFRVYGDPETQGSMRLVGGRMIHDNRRVQSWRDHITGKALAAYKRPIDWPVWVEAIFWLDRPARPRFAEPATAKDLDKLVRALGDALSPKHGPRPISNDARICGWRAEKRWADHDNDPGVLVRIHHAPFGEEDA